MSINDSLEKVKPFYMLVLGLILASIFFALGRLSALEEKHSPIKINYPNSTSTATVANTVSPRGTLGEGVIGSKSGKKYYFPWCGTLKRVKPENQVHFASVEEARLAGYSPAGNCKGLK